jgi:chromosome segregation ATPase
MFAANEKLEQFKQNMNWNQEELLQWSLAAKQKDEDKEALEKYEKIDNVKIKNLTLKMEKAAQSVQDAKKLLDDEVTETQAVQIELDKTAEEYRRLHLQRQDLIRQWNDAVEAMHKRDQDIAKVGEKIAAVKNKSRQRERNLNEMKEFLSAEEVNNKQLQVNIGTASRNAEKKRDAMQAMSQEIVSFNDEVAAQRNELEKAESDLQQTKTQNENLEKMKEEKIKRLNEFKKQLEQTKADLEQHYASRADLTERSQQVDMLHKQHEERMKTINKELGILKESMFKHSRELYDLRKKEADLIAEISGAQGTSRNLQARVHELDQRSLKQQEMLYNIEFQVQQLERKVSRASGKRSMEETVRLNAEIEELEKALGVNKGQHKTITNQVKRLHDDLRAARRKHTSVVGQRDNLSGKIAEIELENDSADREVKESIKKKEDMIVSHDVLKLEVKRLRDTLTSKADEVLNLENRKLQLELSMKEREKEVQLHQEVQKAEHRAAEEARHNLAMDLKERQIKVEKLMQKYETIAGRLKGNGEEEHSQAYYIIASAQRREELQREGDQLNRDIRKSEKEIRMLSKTLAHLTERNHEYRESFNKADMRGEDAKLKADLEEQQRAVADSLYKKKSYLREITHDYEERRRILQELVNNVGGLDQEREAKAAELSHVQKNIAEQEGQMSRASKEMLAKREEFRRVMGKEAGDDSLEEMYITLLEQKRKNRVLLNLLRNFTEDNQDMTMPVSEMLEKEGLKLAQRPTSSGSASGRRPGTGGSRPGTGRSGFFPPVGSRPVSRGTGSRGSSRGPSR